MSKISYRMMNEQRIINLSKEDRLQHYKQQKERLKRLYDKIFDNLLDAIRLEDIRKSEYYRRFEDRFLKESPPEMY